MYSLYKSLLQHYSEYFNTALQGSWKEAEEQSIALEDVESTTFTLFVEWLYTQHLPKATMEWYDISGVEPPDENYNYYVTSALMMVQLYCLADRFMVPKLCKELNRVIITEGLETCWLDPDVLTYAYDFLPEWDPVLSYLVDLQASVVGSKIKDRTQLLPQGLLIRCVDRYRCMAMDRVLEIVACDYHGHTSEQERRDCQQGK
ncbi:hypothetical protein P280DRAFT_264615 [Massarina eburnea CBS 473.64]|uniref:BTB domain-containing protein n=1 Tax=Massarina eburnea CBS 473.64 TaxID=1395130 RepID=A0A6A6S8A3_9PLEO|nr:hypothetical protein P280DRAFT_264615 [Massarina eburnea CBS 473.64]